MPNNVPVLTATSGAPTWWLQPCQIWTSYSPGLIAVLWWSRPSWTMAMVSVCWTSPRSLSSYPRLCQVQFTMPTDSAVSHLERSPSTVRTRAPPVPPFGAWSRLQMACSSAKPRTFRGPMGRLAGLIATVWQASVWGGPRLPSIRWAPFGVPYWIDVILICDWQWFCPLAF